MAPRAARIRARRDGTYDLRLPNEERQLLVSLTGQLSDALGEIDVAAADLDPSLARLFPPAYVDDPDAESSYAHLMRAELLDERREALVAVQAHATAKRLTAEALERWLSAVNSLRLYLGSTLGATENPVLPDPSDPRAAWWNCYHYLSFLEGEIVEALTGTLVAADDLEDLPVDPWGDPPGGLRWDGTPRPDEP